MPAFSLLCLTRPETQNRLFASLNAIRVPLNFRGFYEGAIQV